MFPAFFIESEFFFEFSEPNLCKTLIIVALRGLVKHFLSFFFLRLGLVSGFICLNFMELTSHLNFLQRLRWFEVVCENSHFLQMQLRFNLTDTHSFLLLNQSFLVLKTEFDAELLLSLLDQVLLSVFSRNWSHSVSCHFRADLFVTEDTLQVVDFVVESI